MEFGSHTVIKSKRIILGLSLVHVAVLSSCACAAEPNYSLVLVEYQGNLNGEAQTQSLVRYHFKGGAMVAKENILTTKTSDLRYDLGRNQIYDNRYVVTAWGDVVDLTTRQMLFKGKGRLVGVDKKSGSVIVLGDSEDDGAIHAFELSSHQYRPMRKPGLWTMPGMISPDGRLSASGHIGEIWLHRPSGGKVLLGSDFWRQGTVMCSSMTEPTLLWVDQKHLLTQRGNGQLFIVDTKGRAEPVVNVPVGDVPACGPELRRDGGNNIYYQEAQKAWLIDVTARTIEPYLWEARGDGFDMEYERNASYGHAIRYRRKEIGRWWCGNSVTAPGRIAVEFGEVGSNLGYPMGAKVWSVESGLWITIKPEWLAAVVGWISE